MKRLLASLAFLAVCTANLLSAATPADALYLKEVETERADRLKNLTKDDSWLTLIGLHYLNAIDNTVGRASDNAVVFTSGPDHFGSLHVAPDGTVTFTPSPGTPVTIAGKAVTGPVVLPLGDDNPEAVIVRSGPVSFLLMERGGKKALRVKDNEAPRRAAFKGIQYFPVDTTWRIEATWVPFEAPKDISITNVIGNTYTEKAPGKAVFTRDGKTIELTPIIEEPGDPLFFIFSDDTSGKDSYGMRFLDATPTPDGKIILDFNLCTNPPCAFSPFATCPLPPKGNHVPLPITAGEKAPADKVHE